MLPQNVSSSHIHVVIMSFTHWAADTSFLPYWIIMKNTDLHPNHTLWLNADIITICSYISFNPVFILPKSIYMAMYVSECLWPIQTWGCFYVADLTILHNLKASPLSVVFKTGPLGLLRKPFKFPIFCLLSIHECMLIRPRLDKT